MPAIARQGVQMPPRRQSPAKSVNLDPCFQLSTITGCFVLCRFSSATQVLSAIRDLLLSISPKSEGAIRSSGQWTIFAETSESTCFIIVFRALYSFSFLIGSLT